MEDRPGVARKAQRVRETVDRIAIWRLAEATLERADRLQAHERTFRQALLREPALGSVTA